MTTKNIVNIENNRLDFYINGTNYLEVVLRGTSRLKITETPLGSQIIASQFNSTQQSGNSSFVGTISNIDNHVLGNLNNVNTIGSAVNDFLQYDGTVWHPSDPTNIQNHSINLLSDVDTSGTAVDHVLQYDGTNWMSVDPTNVGATTFSIASGTNIGTFNILSDTLTINRTNKQIDTSFDGTSIFTLSVPTNFTVGGTASTEFSYIQIGDDGANTGMRLNKRDTANSDMSTIVNTQLLSDQHNKYAIGLTNTGGLNLNYSGTGVLGGELKVLNGGNQNVITCATNKKVTVHNDFTVNGDTTIDQNLVVHGNFTVNGTTTYISTEHKLIEDPMIELNYGADGNEGHDVGFYGVIREHNYGGFFYDAADDRFKIFDSYPTNPTNVNNILTTNANFRLANLNVREIELTDGQVCNTIYDVQDVHPVPTLTLTYKNQIDYSIKATSDSTNYLLLSGKLITTVNQGTNHAFVAVKNFIYHKTGSTSTLQMTIDNEYISSGNTWEILELDTEDNTLRVSPGGTHSTDGDYSVIVKMLTVSRIGIS